MAVEIGEVEVVPRRPAEPEQAQPSAAPQAGASNPQLALEIERAMATRHTRDLRLQAD
jgi:hypothetical protein